MKNVEAKTKSLIKIINDCNPADFVRYRFNDFAQDMMYDDFLDESKYFGDFDFDEINREFLDLGFSVSMEAGSDELFDEELPDDNAVIGDLENFPDQEYYGFGNEDSQLYFILGIYVFKCYVKHCFAVAKTTKNNMKTFCEHIEENYFDEDFCSRTVEYYMYIKREGNEDMESQNIELVSNACAFFSELSKFQFAYQIAKGSSQAEIDELHEYIKINYAFFMSALYLTFSNFLNYLNGLNITQGE
jgi:hypothetical protein